MKNNISNILILFLLFVFGINTTTFAQDNLAKDNTTPKHEISAEEQQELWKQPDFVKAYFIVVEPGGALYSVFGHACFHMVCDAYGYDYCFTYESENAVNRILTFLSGRLKMGMIRITLEDYMADYKEEGRAVKEYEINLPIEYKRELWRVLDEKVDEGMNLPYDFVERGCAYACVIMLNEALGNEKVEYGEWSPRFERTRPEICYDFAKRDYPWNASIIFNMIGSVAKKETSNEKKMIMPTEVLETWQHAKFHGEYLLSMEAHELLQSVPKKESTVWFTPMLFSLILLVLAIVAMFIEKPYIDWLILSVVTVLGAILVYLVLFSTLPCTEWNWLIVPFNILPAICWKWRKYWSLPYAVMILIWIFGMLLSLHQMVDNAMIVLAVAFMLIVLNKRNRNYSFEKLVCK